MQLQLLKEKYPSAEAFEMKGGPEAVLLVHGFTGTPAEMRPLAEILHAQLGWQMEGILLPGHGTTIANLAKTPRKAWYEAAESAALSLRKRFDRVHLVGLSMGSLVVTEVLRRHPKDFASIALLAPASYLRSFFQRLANDVVRWTPLAYILPPLHKQEKLHPDHIVYDHYPPMAVREFAKVCEEARNLSTIDAPPTFISYSEADEVVHPKGAMMLAKKLKDSLQRIVRLERSIHVLTLGCEKERLFDEMLKFYREVSPEKATSPSSTQSGPASRSL